MSRNAFIWSAALYSGRGSISTTPLLFLEKRSKTFRMRMRFSSSSVWRTGYRTSLPWARVSLKISPGFLQRQIRVLGTVSKEHSPQAYFAWLSGCSAWSTPGKCESMTMRFIARYFRRRTSSWSSLGAFGSSLTGGRPRISSRWWTSLLTMKWFNGQS